MENEITETKIHATWDEVQEGYVRLERDKAKMLLLIDWDLNYIKKFKDDKTGELKNQLEFSATVLSEDGKPAKKVFSTTSINAIKGLKEILQNKDPSKPVLIRLKKIGEGKSTIYDIEEQEIKK